MKIRTIAHHQGLNHSVDKLHNKDNTLEILNAARREYLNKVGNQTPNTIFRNHGTHDNDTTAVHYLAKKLAETQLKEKIYKDQIRALKVEKIWEDSN